MRRLGHRPQRTLAHPVTLHGTGFLTGSHVRLRFRPAPPNTGYIFLRTDLRHTAYIPATWMHVTGTRRRTTIGHPPHHVSLVEHVLAALAGLRIDNCLIELDASEPPGFDGSALPFVQALLETDLVTQNTPRAIWGVTEAITVRLDDFATLTLHPATHDELRISYLLDYGVDSPIMRQKHTQVITPESFAQELASCRTFLLEHEAQQLQQLGIGLHITPADILVFGPDGPINNRLNFANEPARHKILDVIGDLALFGRDIRGHVVACRSGHPLNVEMVSALADRLQGRKRLAA